MLTSVVVSDVRLYGERLASSLTDASAAGAVRTTANVLEALSLIDEWAPDAVILATPVAGGVQAVEILRWKFPALAIIVLGARDEDAAPCLQAGADAVLTHEASLDELGSSLDRVVSGEPIVPSPHVTALLFQRLRTDTGRHTLDAVLFALTRREREVAGLLGEGLSNKEIGTRLHIAPGTVKCHVHSIRRKLGARTRLELGLRLRDD